MMRHFEDFACGETQIIGRFSLEADDILAFAHEFDPQPMHLDGNSAQARDTGGLIASGWHTAARNMRAMVDGFLGETAGLGAPGIEQLKWLRPVQPGDRLTSQYCVTGMRSSRSKPDRGFVHFTITLTNQHGEQVLEQKNAVMIAVRAPQAASRAEDKAAERENAAATTSTETFPLPPEADDEAIKPIDSLMPGTLLRFGDHHFASEDTLRFSQAFDPQRFHIDEAFARTTHFGGLAASGWHTSAGWMRTVIAFWNARASRGAYVPKLGTSPGFRDMQFLRPVLAGDTLTYCGRILEARRSATRPGWGIVTTRNYAFNQRGVPVFAFTGTVFWGTET